MSNELNKLNEFFSAFFLWINDSPDTKKYTFKLEEGIYHYTIRFWSRRKEIDLHRTDETKPEGDPERYQPILTISYYSIKRILIALKSIDYNAVGRSLLESKIKAGKLKRYKSLLIPIDRDTTVFDPMLIIKQKKSGKRYKLRKGIDLFSHMKPIEVEEGLTHPVGCFSVIQYRRGKWKMNGHVYRFKGTRVHGPRSFIYFKPMANKKMRNDAFEKVIKALDYIQFKNKDSVMAYLSKRIPAVKKYLA